MAKEQKQKTEATEAKKVPEAAPAASGCDDRNCPIHGDLKTHGRVFIATVMKSGSQKTSTVAWERRHYIPKYERYEKRRTKLHVHNPPCINANAGDIVNIAECRPLSKTKKFVITEKVGKKEIRPLIEEEIKPEKKHEAKEKDYKESKEKESKKTERSSK